jgi:hypothetical protein
MSTATRGHCPDALAAEVYRLTHAALHQRFRRPSASKTAVPEAVGAAYVRWLGNPSDKTKHAAAEHAFWLAKTATVFILGGAKNLEKRGRSIRCIAGFATQGDDGMRPADADPNEMLYRAHYEVAALDGHEDNLIAAMDEYDAHQKATAGKVCATWHDALMHLLGSGWTRRHLADALGVHYASVNRYIKQQKTPHGEVRQRTLIDLAAAGGSAPTHEPATTTPSYRKRRAARAS